MEQGNIHNVVRVLRVEMIKAQRSKTIDGNIYFMCLFRFIFIPEAVFILCEPVFQGCSFSCLW